MKHYFFGFSLWKHNFLLPFLDGIDKNDIVFINPFFKKNYFKLALKKGLDGKSSIYIWGRKSFPLVEKYAQDNNLKLYRVEDGFIRSIGLGSDLTQPYSLVIDSRGIYFDPTQESDLEYLLKTTQFDEDFLKRAEEIKKYLIDKKVSKYNLFKNENIKIDTKKKIVLVPGQVEDDASIKYGASGMSNLKLLKLARVNVKDSYIIYKPHPDVLVGNRVGHIDEEIALKYADKIITEVGLDSVLSIADEVHTMTSLVGFEALVRGKKVTTYGIPFYAGWGLTNDTVDISHRKRILSLNALVGVVLLLYPKYINPVTLQPTSVEILIKEMEQERLLYSSSWSYRVKKKVYSFITRKLQLLLRIITLKN
jgi:capsular polysaccharide export protein